MLKFLPHEEKKKKEKKEELVCFSSKDAVIQIHEKPLTELGLESISKLFKKYPLLELDYSVKK